MDTFLIFAFISNVFKHFDKLYLKYIIYTVMVIKANIMVSHWLYRRRILICAFMVIFIRFHWNWLRVWEARGSRAGAEDWLLQCEWVHTTAYWPASGEGEIKIYHIYLASRGQQCPINHVWINPNNKINYLKKESQLCDCVRWFGRVAERLLDPEFNVFLSLQDIVPVDASYEVKELYVQENKLDLAKADAETLPAVQIVKVMRFPQFLLNLKIKHCRNCSFMVALSYFVVHWTVYPQHSWSALLICHSV